MILRPDGMAHLNERPSLVRLQRPGSRAELARSLGLSQPTVGKIVLSYEALLRAGVPAELHAYPAGTHGFALQPKNGPVSD